MTSSTHETTIHALPGDLLLNIFRLLPQRTATSPCGGFSVSSRGGVERVCRQWRALALSPALPVTAEIDTCELTGNGAFCGLELTLKLSHVLPPRRTVEKLGVNGLGCLDDGNMEFELPRLLPSVTSLRLQSYEGIRFAQHLTCCIALRELEISLLGLSEEEDEDVWTAETLQALGSLTALKTLTLDLRTEPSLDADDRQQQLPPRLTQCIDGCLTALDGLSLLYAGPSEARPLPRALRELSVALLEQSQVPALAALLPRCSRLERLCIHDDEWARDEEAPSDELLFLPGLESLPSLRELHCAGRIPPQAWGCPSLQVLSARMCSLEIPPGLDRVLPSLRRLRLTSCWLPDNGFPAALCAARQLSSIAIQDTDLEGDREGGGLPPEISRLTSLQRLVVHGAVYMAPSDVAALCPLTSLTELHLEDCGVSELPLGRCLTGLQVLNIARNYFPQLVPPELHHARCLRALAVSPPMAPGHSRGAHPPLRLGLADWRQTKAVLESLHLKVLHVYSALNDEQGMPHPNVAPTLGLLRSELGLVPRMNGDFDAQFYPEHSQHAPYEDVCTDWE